MALCSCQPQSQRAEPNTSPVRHLECIRTSTRWLTVRRRRTPARCARRRSTSLLVADDAELAERRRQPRLARRGAPAARVVSRYATSCATVMNVSPCCAANCSSSGRRAIVPSAFRISQITPAGYSPGEPGEIHARLGLADPLQHAAGPRAQREHVPGAPQVARDRGGIDRDADRRRAVGRRDPGRDAEARARRRC